MISIRIRGQFKRALQPKNLKKWMQCNFVNNLIELFSSIIHFSSACPRGRQIPIFSSTCPLASTPWAYDTPAYVNGCNFAHHWLWWALLHQSKSQTQGRVEFNLRCNSCNASSHQMHLGEYVICGFCSCCYCTFPFNLHIHYHSFALLEWLVVSVCLCYSE